MVASEGGGAPVAACENTHRHGPDHVVQTPRSRPGPNSSGCGNNLCRACRFRCALFVYKAQGRSRRFGPPGVSRRERLGRRAR